MRLQMSSMVLFLLLVGCSSKTGPAKTDGVTDTRSSTTVVSSTEPVKATQPVSRPALPEPKTEEEAIKVVTDLGGKVQSGLGGRGKR